jgi:hypothetical protein
MNTFTCLICGEQVSKRQSLSYGGKLSDPVGRACRKHTEVQESTKARLAAEDKKRQEEHEQLQRMMKKHRPEYVIPNGPTCWHCHTEGIRTQDHWLRMMVANEKCALQGKTLLDFDALATAYGEFKPILVFVKVWKGHDLVTRTRDGALMHSMCTGHMFVCLECAKKFNLEPEWQKAFQPAEVSPEALKAMMVISDSLPLTHAVKALAKLEVAMEVQNG